MGINNSNFPTKGLRSKRRRYFHIFQVEVYLTYCEESNCIQQNGFYKAVEITDNNETKTCADITANNFRMLEDTCTESTKIT